MYSGRPVYSPVTALAVPHGISNPVLDLFEYSTSHGVHSMPSCGMVPYRGFLNPLDTNNNCKKATNNTKKKPAHKNQRTNNCSNTKTNPERYPMYGHTYSKSMDQPGKVASPARGQLNRETLYFLVRVPG